MTDVLGSYFKTLKWHVKGAKPYESSTSQGALPVALDKAYAAFMTELFHPAFCRSCHCAEEYT